MKIKSPIASKYEDCIAKAAEEGVTVFGMDDRRCWTGTGKYDKHGASGQCKKSKKGDKSMGLSASETMFVYKKDASGNANVR